MDCATIFGYYAPSLLIDKFKLNIFINGIVVGASDVVSYPICYHLIMRTRRRIVATVCFAVSAVCSVILVFIWEQDSDEAMSIQSSIGILVLIFLFKFMITL